MSSTTKNIIARQWQIIDYLLQMGNYVSTIQIQDYLKSIGMEAEMRTIQRDLKLLQEIIPLECRTDDKPYSWRWQRLDKAKKHQLSLSQAVAFRLIETELKEHIPQDLMTQLEPVLMKARFVLAMGNVSESLYNEISKDEPRSRQPFGFINQNPINKVVADIHYFFKNFSLPQNPFISSSAKFSEIDKLLLKDLEKELQKLDMTELVDEINKLAK